MQNTVLKFLIFFVFDNHQLVLLIEKFLFQEFQYIYIPIVNKIITIDSDGSMTSFTFKVLDVEYQKSSILIIDKTDDYEDGTIYVRKKHDDKNQ